VPKRFTDTEIWKKQRWFRKLKPNHKLAFLYIKDQCDHAGIWNIECSDLMEDTGIDNFDIAQFTADCNTEYDKISGKITLKERIRILDNGYLWVTGFIQFQCKGKEGLVNPYAAPVTTAIQRLNGLNLLQEALDKSYLTLTEGLPEGYLTPKEKEEEREEVYLKDRGMGKGNFKNKNKNGKPEQPVVNFKAQAELLFAERMRKHAENKLG
jgi:hypothetical protein